VCRAYCTCGRFGMMSCLGMLLCLAAGAVVVARGQLTDDFYDDCCLQAGDIVRARVSAAMNAEPRMGASLLRLHFHDCFVNVRARVITQTN
jgi:peroxidase